MDVITTAIIAGLAGLSKDAIKDSYNALKGALKKKFGSESDLVEAVEKLEKTPDREDRQATVKTEVEIAKANDNAEILELAKKLIAQAKSEGVATVSKYNVEFQGEVKGAQIGDRNVQQNKF